MWVFVYYFFWLIVGELGEGWIGGDDLVVGIGYDDCFVVV